LETNRFILGGVDVSYLTRVQGDPKPRSGITTFVIAVPHHDVHAAIAAVRFVKGEDALATNRRDDGVVRTDRAQDLCDVAGTRGETIPAKNDETGDCSQA
jgi:hypothetical protein